jgi:hypothetical protein
VATAPGDAALGSNALPGVVDRQQAKRSLEGGAVGLDPGTRVAALSAINDPMVGQSPAAVRAPSSAAIATRADAAASTSGLGAEGGVPLSTADTSGSVEEGTVEPGEKEGTAGSETASADQPTEAQMTAEAETGEGGASQAAVAEPSADSTPVVPGTGAGVTSGETTPAVPDTGAGALGTGDLVLIDVELAEHQRWAGALGRVGELASLQRAEFVAEAVGGGFVNGAASGLAMGLGMGAVTRFVPAIGPVIGGAMALHGLATRDWAETGATIGRFGEGNDTYETLANSIASVAAAIDVVSQILTVINGIVGVVQIAAAVIAGGAVVAAFFTFGATLGIAVIAGDVVATCEEISLAIGEVTTLLDGLNAAILQPCVTLFRALHAFTTQADPREVEAQGQSISTAAAASGAALGAWAGGKAAHAGAHPQPPADDLPPSQRPAHETPPPATGDGPTVHFQEPATPVAQAEGGPIATPLAEPIATAAAPALEVPTPQPVATAEPIAPPPVTELTSVSAPAESIASAATAAPEAILVPTTGGEPVSAAPAGAAAPPPATAAPEQLTLPHTEGSGSELRPITAPLELQGIKGTDPIPQGLAPGAIGTYGRAVPAPHPAALASNPPGAPGATAGGGRMPDTGRKAAGVYLEHQTSAAAAHEVLPGHELHGPQGQRRGGQDTQEALVVSLPEPVKSIKDAGDRALLAEVQSRIAQGEDVPPIEVIARSAQITQDAIAQAAANVPGQQISRNFLAEVDQFNNPRFGYQEVRPGEPLPAGHPLAAASSAELDAFLNRTFDPFIAPAKSGGGAPPSTSPPVQPAPNPSQMSFDFGAGTAAASHAPPAVTPAAPPVVTSAVAPVVPVSVTPDVLPALPAITPVAPPTGAVAPATISKSPTPQAMTSPTVSSLSAAAGAARTAVGQQSTGGPQPGSTTPTFGTRAHQVGALFLPQLFGGGGEPPTYAQRRAAHRARFTGDNQPAEGVERVNPEYPPPPATPAQITAIQNQIMNLLTVRAAAEQEAQQQADRADQCEENQGPIQQTIADTTAGISAVQAHDAAVARREAVNQEQQQRQQESEGLVAGYPSRAVGLTALTIPLAAWEQFTSLASHLPGEAGASMLRMNQEARKMQEAFDQMGAQMLGVESAGPTSEQGLQDDQALLDKTGQLARASDEQLHTASTGAVGLQQANEAALAEADDRRETATERAQESSDAAAEREAQADSLAEQLRAWSRLHAQARQQAVAATTQRLQSEGRIVVRSSEQ